MRTGVATLEADSRVPLVAAFFGGIRWSCAHYEHFRWTRANSEKPLALCERIEQLGLPAAYLVVQLCCAGRDPLRFEEAAAIVEAVCRPAAP